jgi:hypothetical protein
MQRKICSHFEKFALREKEREREICVWFWSNGGSSGDESGEQ